MIRDNPFYISPMTLQTYFRFHLSLLFSPFSLPMFIGTSGFYGSISLALSHQRFGIADKIIISRNIKKYQN
jgi:hypothetical protein